MKQRFAGVALVFVLAGTMSIACSDDDSPGSAGGAGGAMSGAAGIAGEGGDAEGGTSGKGASGSGGELVAGGDFGGAAGVGVAGTGATIGMAGGAGVGQGGSSGADNGAAGGESFAGEGGALEGAEVLRGRYLVHSLALCGGCHTPSGGAELSGNPQFKGGMLPAPNLTPDETGLGSWTDAQIIGAIRDGVDDEGRHLDPAMPSWLFHNMSDADAAAVVAFLRSLSPVVAAVGANNPDAAAVTPLAPSALPDTTLATTDPEYAAAQTGKYLVSGVAQCVKCHSPSASGLPTSPYFSGVTPANMTQIFASNITPDATGIATWTAADVVTALKQGKDKAGAALCGSMPSALKGYGGMSDSDAHAIGVYLTTIAPVSNAAAAPSLEPACP